VTRSRTALLVGTLLVGSCSAPMTPPYLDIRDPDKASIVDRVVDGRQIVITGKHVERHLYHHWYSPNHWLWGDYNGRGVVILETEKCGRLSFGVVDDAHAYASCATQCRPPTEKIPKDCPLGDDPTRERWTNVQWRIVD